MKHRSFPKEREKKLKQTIQELKGRVNFLEKENKFLKQELEGRIQQRTKSQTIIVQTHEEWRKDFLDRYKREVLSKGKKVGKT